MIDVIAEIPVRLKSTPGLADSDVQSMDSLPVTENIIDAEVELVNDEDSVAVSDAAFLRTSVKSCEPPALEFPATIIFPSDCKITALASSLLLLPTSIVDLPSVSKVESRVPSVL